MMAAFEDSDFEKMEEIRARVRRHRRRPGDGREPEGLVPPALQAAVLPRRVPAGLQRARRPPGRHRRPGRRAHHREGRRGRRPRVRGRLHHLRVGLRGRHRVQAPRRLRPRSAATALKLSEAWADGMRSKHGIHVHGFPNAFFVQPTQGANLISNVPHNLTEAGQTIAAIVRHAHGRGRRGGRGHPGGRGRLGRRCCSPASAAMIGSPDCTPGYYNNEGQDRRPRRPLRRRLPAGASAYFNYIDEWRTIRRVRGPRVPVGATPATPFVGTRHRCRRGPRQARRLGPGASSRGAPP